MCLMRKWVFMNTAVLFYLVPFFVLMVVTKGGGEIESFFMSEIGLGAGPSHFMASLLLMQPTVLMLLGRKVFSKIWHRLDITRV